MAQEAKTYRIKAEADLRYAIPVAERYRYPQFKEGTVTFFNSSTANAKLNYNFQLGEVQFINLTRDTMSLANEQTIKQIQIADSHFYYDVTHGYVESVAEYSGVQLVVKEMFKVAAVEKMASMGKSSATSSIKEINVLSTGNSSVQKLASRGDVVLAKERTYFLRDTNNRFYKTTKAGFLKLFPKNKKAIDVYLEEQKIDFSNPEDLKKALQYAAELP
ncbi:MAG: hypothetical protein MUE30_16975 [Spirosomaceae bacterium]|jgi:hypothetical protein|nr:hypothetical protein [Spirosomataceae bacterium]